MSISTTHNPSLETSVSSGALLQDQTDKLQKIRGLPFIPIRKPLISHQLPESHFSMLDTTQQLPCVVEFSVAAKLGMQLIALAQLPVPDEYKKPNLHGEICLVPNAYTGLKDKFYNDMMEGTSDDSRTFIEILPDFIANGVAAARAIKNLPDCPPVLAAKIQDIFDQTELPCIAQPESANIVVIVPSSFERLAGALSHTLPEIILTTLLGRKPVPSPTVTVNAWNDAYQDMIIAADTHRLDKTNRMPSF